jgi:hypothetical protein
MRERTGLHPSIFFFIEHEFVRRGTEMRERTGLHPSIFFFIEHCFAFMSFSGGGR